MITVIILGPREMLFEGTVSHVTLPGECGVFEVWPCHRPLVSRLLSGVVRLDDRGLPIRRGVVRVANDTVTALVEPADQEVAG